MSKKKTKRFDFNSLKYHWPSPLVPRTEISRFSGGLFSEKSLANHDCYGTGPKERIRIGNRICYPVHSLIEWMESQSEQEPAVKISIGITVKKRKGKNGKGGVLQNLLSEFYAIKNNLKRIEKIIQSMDN